ncbi:hypothetical protein SRHO_G00328590 [Serrasalmus rhombeus]
MTHTSTLPLKYRATRVIKRGITCKETSGEDAPQSSLYSKDDVQLGSKNTLVCYITGFYPPHVGVSWTRNNSNVTDRVSLSRYYLNDDETYNLVSTLSFTPEQGDIYTCTVGHTALDRPLTKTWDVQVALPGVGPTVFCGVGLAAGLLGVAVGTFFLIKGNNYPSLSESERNKIAIGASGLVLGIILSAAGFIYYKKKSSGSRVKDLPLISGGEAEEFDDIHPI